MVKQLSRYPFVTYISHLYAMQETFKEVAVRYGLQTPTQVKQRIIWENLKAIVEKLYGHTPRNEQMIAQFEVEWRSAETEENKGT